VVRGRRSVDSVVDAPYAAFMNLQVPPEQVMAAVFEAANSRDAKAGTLLFTRYADFVTVLGMW
jgi:hypothetical protein